MFADPMSESAAATAVTHASTTIGENEEVDRQGQAGQINPSDNHHVTSSIGGSGGNNRVDTNISNTVMGLLAENAQLRSQLQLSEEKRVYSHLMSDELREFIVNCTRNAFTHHHDGEGGESSTASENASLLLKQVAEEKSKLEQKFEAFIRKSLMPLRERNTALTSENTALKEECNQLRVQQHLMLEKASGSGDDGSVSQSVANMVKELNMLKQSESLLKGQLAEAQRESKEVSQRLESVLHSQAANTIELPQHLNTIAQQAERIRQDCVQIKLLENRLEERERRHAWELSMETETHQLFVAVEKEKSAALQVECEQKRAAMEDFSRNLEKLREENVKLKEVATFCQTNHGANNDNTSVDDDGGGNGAIRRGEGGGSGLKRPRTEEFDPRSASEGFRDACIQAYLSQRDMDEKLKGCQEQVKKLEMQLRLEKGRLAVMAAQEKSRTEYLVVLANENEKLRKEVSDGSGQLAALQVERDELAGQLGTLLSSSPSVTPCGGSNKENTNDYTSANFFQHNASEGNDNGSGGGDRSGEPVMTREALEECCKAIREAAYKSALHSHAGSIGGNTNESREAFIAAQQKTMRNLKSEIHSLEKQKEKLLQYIEMRQQRAVSLLQKEVSLIHSHHHGDDNKNRNILEYLMLAERAAQDIVNRCGKPSIAPPVATTATATGNVSGAGNNFYASNNYYVNSNTNSPVPQALNHNNNNNNNNNNVGNNASSGTNSVNSGVLLYLQQEVFTLRESKAALEAEVQSLRESMRTREQEASEKIATLESDGQAKETSLASLRETLDRLGADYQAARNAVASLSDRYAQVSSVATTAVGALTLLLSLYEEERRFSDECRALLESAHAELAPLLHQQMIEKVGKYFASGTGEEAALLARRLDELAGRVEEVLLTAGDLDLESEKTRHILELSRSLRREEEELRGLQGSVAAKVESEAAALVTRVLEEKKKSWEIIWKEKYRSLLSDGRLSQRRSDASEHLTGVFQTLALYSSRRNENGNENEEDNQDNECPSKEETEASIAALLGKLKERAAAAAAARAKDDRIDANSNASATPTASAPAPPNTTGNAYPTESIPATVDTAVPPVVDAPAVAAAPPHPPNAGANDDESQANEAEHASTTAPQENEEEEETNENHINAATREQQAEPEETVARHENNAISNTDIDPTEYTTQTEDPVVGGAVKSEHVDQ